MTDNFNKTPAAQGKRRSGYLPQVQRYVGTVDDLVAAQRPDIPLYVLQPETLIRRAAEFRALFAGEVMYAVKCNPHKIVFQSLLRGGITAFDAASIAEVRLCTRLAPKSKIYFMHPVKSPEAIREAYFVHGVRAFSLDTAEELYKIVRETDLASDLELFVRTALPKNDSAAIDFSGKFGAAPAEVSALLRQCRAVSARLGLCFHVGTQNLDPHMYERGIALVSSIISDSGVTVDALDIGGGFPAARAYPGQDVPAPLAHYMKVIAAALARHDLSDMPLLCEPGRALVADAGSLIVRVEQRRGDVLYINDGTYGGLFDGGAQLQTRFPVRAIRSGGTFENSSLTPFRFAGPTCDSLDMMDGPFDLPADIKTGDWIEIGNMGAYSAGLRSDFNGFGRSATIALYDAPTAVSRPRRTVTTEGRRKTQ